MDVQGAGHDRQHLFWLGGLFPEPCWGANGCLSWQALVEAQGCHGIWRPWGQRWSTPQLKPRTALAYCRPVESNQKIVTFSKEKSFCWIQFLNYCFTLKIKMSHLNPLERGFGYYLNLHLITVCLLQWQLLSPLSIKVSATKTCMDYTIKLYCPPHHETPQLGVDWCPHPAEGGQGSWLETGC